MSSGSAWCRRRWSPSSPSSSVRWVPWSRPRTTRIQDNGIKLFAAGGTKLSDEVETAIERELDALQTPDARARAWSAPIDESFRRGIRRSRHVPCVTPTGSGHAAHRGRCRPRCRPPAGARGVRATGRRRDRDRRRAERHEHQRRLSGRPRPQALGAAVRDHGADLGHRPRRRRRPADRRRPSRLDRRRRSHHRDLRTRHASNAGTLRDARGRRHDDDEPRLPPGDARGGNRRRHHRRRRPVRARGARRRRPRARWRAERPRDLRRPRHDRRRDADGGGARRRRGPDRTIARRSRGSRR